LQEYLDEGVPVLVPMTYENEGGETVHADAEVMVEPGTTGFVRAFVDKLSSPFDCDPETLADLPVHDIERDCRYNERLKPAIPGFWIREF
jgi:hypothetical protein